MTHLTPAKRAVRASTSLLRPIRTTPTIACRGQRLFHESGKAKAVEAVATRTPLTHEAPPPPFAPIQQPTKPVQPIRPSQQAFRTNQLNILEQSHKPEFYETISKIMDIRQRYVEDRSVFIESRDMVPLMLGLGASPEDMERLQVVSDHLYHDPTLPFRRSRNGRFCIDFDTNTLRRLEFQPFMLSLEEDFKRHDSGKIRRFDEVQDELQLNSVFQALFTFKAMILHGVHTVQRPKLEYDSNKWVTTLFNLRTVTTPDILGEPALEGVHSDGVDHTMTTYLGSNNMAPNSAATFMHGMGETTGSQLDEISPHHLLSRVQHKNFLDTLVIVDHERKHSLSAVYPVDKTKEATRDMLIFFTRKPVEKTHTSGSIDSLTPHQDMPMEVPIFVPRA
ncbi:hypothetical protein TOPH_03030 [Tolypocladium ophioglossoides CBS 100239]|uniref:Uncharacterized protein n=1 Tax=Tolypocladium ophioglossoides (strain CBS 100239) TaxID=1163406 RepID=A0A0L0NDJ4_TOLOC|nr:hypothetical protein TOPH_03030 [Tolypocladium ophioglossoides CBS 100239]